MIRSILSTLALSFSLVAIAAPAFADVPAPITCDGKKAGAACRTDSGDDGVCKSSSGKLTCDTDASTTTATSTSSASTSSGCSMGASGTGAGGLAFVAAAAALTVARRRRRRT